MAAGYSSRPLWQKLGLKPGLVAWILNPPDDYHDLLAGVPDGISFAGESAAPLDFIHFFTFSSADLRATLPHLKESIRSDGMIWVSWPKKASGVTTDLTEGVIRDFALEIGLVDVKVAAVDTTWSGLKLVCRLKDR